MTDQPAYASQIIQPGDVIAVGLTDRRCPVGIVTAVDDRGIRLDLYSWITTYFSAGTAVVLWAEAARFAFARQRDDEVWDMEPLRMFQTAWQTSSDDLPQPSVTPTENSTGEGGRP